MGAQETATENICMGAHDSGGHRKHGRHFGA